MLNNELLDCNYCPHNYYTCYNKRLITVLLTYRIYPYCKRNKAIQRKAPLQRDNTELCTNSGVIVLSAVQSISGEYCTTSDILIKKNLQQKACQSTLEFLVYGLDIRLSKSQFIQEIITTKIILFFPTLICMFGQLDIRKLFPKVRGAPN